MRSLKTDLHWSDLKIVFTCFFVDVAKVCGVDLRSASHEQAVEAIRRAGDTVTFLVQSGQDGSQVQHLRKQPKIADFW